MVSLVEAAVDHDGGDRVRCYCDRDRGLFADMRPSSLRWRNPAARPSSSTRSAAITPAGGKALRDAAELASGALDLGARGLSQ